MKQRIKLEYHWRLTAFNILFFFKTGKYMKTILNLVILNLIQMILTVNIIVLLTS